MSRLLSSLLLLVLITEFFSLTVNAGRQRLSDDESGPALVAGKGRSRHWKSLQRQQLQLQRSEAVAALQTSLKPFHDFHPSGSVESSYSDDNPLLSSSDHFHASSSYDGGVHPGHSHHHHNNNNPFEENDFMGAELKPSGHECQDIRIDVCRGIGYNVTSMPNFVGHELQSDAELQLQSFMPLVQYGCSSQLLFFLCSVYTPMCTEKVAVIIGPCRPLCESVRSRCAPVLQELGFPWPAALNCSKFVPVNTIDHMCMEGPPPEEPEDTSSYSYGVPPTSSKDSRYGEPLMPVQPVPSIHAGSHPSPPILHNENIVPENSLSNPKSPLPNNHPNPIDLYPTLHHKTFDQDQLGSMEDLSHDKKCSEYRHPQHYVFLEHPRGRCVSRCNADVLFSSENKQFVDYWTSVWAFLSLASCAFTLLTFILNPQQFRYPERAIVYIAACYSIYSMTYIYRAIVGRNTLSCYQESTIDVSLLVQEGAHNFHCTLSFVMLYYFGMAGAAWWLILAISWSLATAFGFSSARLSEHGQIYHSVAWVLPALQTLAVLVTRAVDADELTGTCFVGNQDDTNLLRFVIIPMAFYTGTGILLIVSSLIFVRYFTTHDPCEDEQDCGGCCSGAGGDQSDSSGHTTDADTDPSSVQNSPNTNASSTVTNTTTTGCGNFCRRLRNSCSVVSSNGHLRPSGGQAGSGHSLLLPPVGHQSSVNFCSTVSSTSSYSSSASSKGQNVLMSNTGTGRCQHYPHANQTNRHPLFSNGAKPYGQALTNAATTTGIGTNPAASHLLRSNLTSVRKLRPNRFHLRRAHCSAVHPHSTLRNPFSCSQRSVTVTLASIKDHAILVRSGIFALFYTLPAICVLIACVYEYLNRTAWLRYNDDHQQSGGTSANNNPNNQSHDQSRSNPNFEVFNMKLFMSLVIGIKTGIWILTAKNPINTWRYMFSRCFMKKQVGGHFMQPNQQQRSSGGGQAQLQHHHHQMPHLHLHHPQQQQLQQQISGYPQPNANLNLNFNLSHNPNHQNHGRTQSTQSSTHQAKPITSTFQPGIASSNHHTNQGDRFFFQGAGAEGSIGTSRTTATSSSSSGGSSSSHGSSVTTNNNNNKQYPGGMANAAFVAPTTNSATTNPFTNPGSIVYQPGASSGAATAAFLSSSLNTNPNHPHYPHHHHEPNSSSAISHQQQPLLQSQQQQQFRTGNETAV